MRTGNKQGQDGLIKPMDKLRVIVLKNNSLRASSYFPTSVNMRTQNFSYSIFRTIQMKNVLDGAYCATRAINTIMKILDQFLKTYKNTKIKGSM